MSDLYCLSLAKSYSSRIEDKLNHLHFHSLDRRRVRGDLIHVFKWIEGLDNVNINNLLAVSKLNRTRSNGFKLNKFRVIKDIGKNWFTDRMVD